MIWAVHSYVQRYRLTDRPLASTPLWSAPWIKLQHASHYYIIKIIRQLDNSKSIWLYLFYSNRLQKNIVVPRFCHSLSLKLSLISPKSTKCAILVEPTGCGIRVLFWSKHGIMDNLPPDGVCCTPSHSYGLSLDMALYAVADCVS